MNKTSRYPYIGRFVDEDFEETYVLFLGQDRGIQLKPSLSYDTEWRENVFDRVDDDAVKWILMTRQGRFSRNRNEVRLLLDGYLIQMNEPYNAWYVGDEYMADQAYQKQIVKGRLHIGKANQVYRTIYKEI